MPRTLFLHIGAHKTGTSAIQRACHEDRRALRRQGWHVAEQPRPPVNWGDGFKWAQADATIRLSGPTLAAIRTSLNRARGDAILSAEDLFFLEKDEIARFAQAVRPGFERVRILAYLRRQDELAASQKAQAAKSVKAGRLFGLDHARLPHMTPFLRGYLSFDDRLAAWQEAFPAAEMVVRVYDRAAFAGGSVVDDFAGILGVRLKAGRGDENVTLGANAVRLLVDLRAAGAPSGTVKQVIRAGILDPDPARFLPAEAEARAFLAQFEASNRALEAAFGVRFHDDFSRYPAALGEDGFAAYETRNLRKLIEYFGGKPDRADDPASLRRQLCALMQDHRPRRGLARLFAR